MSKRILALTLTLIMAFGLVACGECSHEWTEASCTEASVCTKCSEVNGEPLGHNWNEASCSAPETCSNCGETKGELLPHSYGAWNVNDPDMTRSCTVCGDTETQPLDYKLVLNSALDGIWELYLNENGSNSFDAYSVVAASSVKFDSGICKMYIPKTDGSEITGIEEYLLEIAAVSYDDGTFNFSLVADDSSTMPAMYYTDEEWLVLGFGKDNFHILTKNQLERESLSGIWICPQGGELFYIDLQPDGSFTGEINGPVSGTWHPKPMVDSYDAWYTGFGIIYPQGDVYEAYSGEMWLCSLDMDVEDALRNNYASSITLYNLDGEWLGFEKLINMSLEELQTAQKENADKIVGTWVSDSMKRSGSDGTDSEESSEFSISFNADGSFTSNLPELADATWSYRGVEPNGNSLSIVFDVVFNDNESSLRIDNDDGSMYLSYNSKSAYHSGHFKMA